MGRKASRKRERAFLRLMNEMEKGLYLSRLQESIIMEISRNPKKYERVIRKLEKARKGEKRGKEG